MRKASGMLIDECHDQRHERPIVREIQKNTQLVYRQQRNQ